MSEQNQLAKYFYRMKSSVRSNVSFPMPGLTNNSDCTVKLLFKECNEFMKVQIDRESVKVDFLPIEQDILSHVTFNIAQTPDDIMQVGIDKSKISVEGIKEASKEKTSQILNALDIAYTSIFGENNNARTLQFQ